MSQTSALSSSLGQIVAVPLGFFIAVGIYYLLARAFGGHGTFLRLFYTYLLFEVPLGIISYLLFLIPFAGVFISLALGIYEIVLSVYMMMAVHRLSGGKATLVTLLLFIVLFALACLILIFALVAAAGARPH